jgi:hypothetical protein
MASESRPQDPDLIDRLGNRVAENVAAASDLDGRDPAFIKAIMPRLDAALRWFDPEVTGFENLPENGPMLIVGNHSGVEKIRSKPSECRADSAPRWRTHSRRNAQ